MAGQFKDEVGGEEALNLQPEETTAPAEGAWGWGQLAERGIAAVGYLGEGGRGRGTSLPKRNISHSQWDEDDAGRGRETRRCRVAVSTSMVKEMPSIT